jgi:hypothetical protein
MALAFEPLPLTVEAADLAIAHGAHESGWGRGLAARLGHNMWNLTRLPSDPRPVIKGGDVEPDGHGGWRTITQRFRAYASDHEAAADYLAFLQRQRYAPAYAALLAGDVAAFVMHLHDDDPKTAQAEGGFFTADPVEYLRGMTACLRLVEHIRRPFNAVA